MAALTCSGCSVKWGRTWGSCGKLTRWNLKLQPLVSFGLIVLQAGGKVLGDPEQEAVTGQEQLPEVDHVGRVG